MGILLAALCLLHMLPVPGHAAQDYLADGLKALDAQQPAVAEPLLRKAVEADPADVEAHFNLALALSLQRKDPEAVAELRKTLELKPGLYEADLNLGILLVRDKEPAAALVPLREAVAAKPKEFLPALYYAQALFDSADFAGAERAYGAAAELDPKNPAAPQGQARALLKLGRIGEAAGRFRAAGSQEGLLEAAIAFDKAGNRAEAIAIYKEFPDHPGARQRLGELQLDAAGAGGDAQTAVANLEEAVRKNPTTTGRLALADAYRMNKQPDKMAEQLQLAASGDPGTFEIRMSLGRALRDAHKLIPAAQQFQVAAKLQPDSAQAWNELASVLIVNENYAEGLAALDHVRALGKEIPGDFFLRAITLDRLKMKPQAMAAYQQFLDADKGAHADQEFQARQRIRIIGNELKKK